MIERLSPNARTALRVAAGIAIAIAAGSGALLLLFVGAVTSTGCFIKCSQDPNVLGGSLLLAGAVLCASLTISAVVWGAIGWNRSVLAKVAGTVAVLSTLVVLGVVGA